MSGSLGGEDKGEDKWKDIDNQISSMTDWIPSQIGSLSNQRQGHTHRRSEPDVVMIRKALPPQPVPSSAPVQPGGFVLDWPIKNTPPPGPSPLATTRHKADVEGLASPACSQSHDHMKAASKGYLNHSTNSNRHMDSVSRSRMALGQGDGPSTTAINGPKAPPPYHPESQTGAVSAPSSVSGMPFVTRANSPSINYTHHTGTHTPPIGVIPELSSQVHHPLPQSRMASASYASSPKSSRRSSAPGNQLDPRSHSASPNITRRSTSHSTAVLRSRTQENFSNLLPSVRHNERIQPGIHTAQSSLYFQPVHPSTPEKVMVSITASGAAPLKDTSTYDDQEYTKVLLQHQHERMERLRRELKSKKELLDSLTLSVGKMENEVFQKKKEKTSTLTLSDVTKLRDENRQIEIDCNCMIKEVDSLSKSGNALNKNFHEFISNRNFKNKSWQGNDPLPPPPLPPPPVPPPVESEEEGKWSCSYCTFLNHAALNKCEMCEYRRETLTLRARQHRT